MEDDFPEKLEPVTSVVLKLDRFISVGESPKDKKF
jgi:hypothetical protein